MKRDQVTREDVNAIVMDLLAGKTWDRMMEYLCVNYAVPVLKDEILTASDLWRKALDMKGRVETLEARVASLEKLLADKGKVTL